MARLRRDLSLALALLASWIQYNLLAAAATNCSTTSCGIIPVQFPFGLVDGCGVQGYRLSCSDSILRLSESTVGSIDYSSRNLLLSSGAGCPLGDVPAGSRICGNGNRSDAQRICLAGYTGCCVERNASLDGEGCVGFSLSSNSSSTTAAAASLGEFSLKWSMQLQNRCDACSGGGNGQCGYNSTTDFVCFCGAQNTTTICSVTGGRTNTPIILSGSVAIAVIVVVLVFGVSLSVYWKWKKNGREDTPEPIFTLDGHDPSRDVEQLREILASRRGDPAKLYTLAEVDKATNGFDKDHKIGSGGFGTVYRAAFDDGSVLAIKRANQTSKQSSQHFFNEVAILSQVNHRNLLRLMGCCIDSEVPILVYEYIPNGTLFDHLHKRPGVLSWNNRLRIAIETAEALSYLHSAAYPPIYHRDVKSANILLDNAFTTKVADFGLSRLVPVDVTHVSTMVQGTPGYVDPEYHQTYQLTDKSDVYSFGVVLLEIVTGRKPVDFSRSSKDVNLSNYSVPLIRKGLIEEIIDPKLISGDGFDLELLESVRSVANVAAACLAFGREDRPTMKRVLEELVVIRGSDGLVVVDRARWLDGEVAVSESLHPSGMLSFSSTSASRTGDRSTELTAR